MSGHHIVTPKTYVAVLCALLFLMVLTMAASYVHVGAEGAHHWNLLIALAIALCKMSLIIAFFMHVKYSSKLTQVFAASGFLWLIIFFVLMGCDYYARASDNPIAAPFVAGSPYGG